jgi:hypothetical protein
MALAFSKTLSPYFSAARPSAPNATPQGLTAGFGDRAMYINNLNESFRSSCSGVF